MRTAALDLFYGAGATCIKCGRDLPVEEFGRDQTKANGLKGSCRSCEKIRLAANYLAHAQAKLQRSKEHRKQNPDHYRKIEKRRRLKRDPELMKRYREKYHRSEHGKLQSRLATARRRVLMRGLLSTFTRDDWLELVGRQRRCYHCKKPFNTNRPPTLDHLIPISRGGEHIKTNIVAACGSCNSIKSDKRVVLL